jgi:hypothetical protein
MFWHELVVHIICFFYTFFPVRQNVLAHSMMYDSFNHKSEILFILLNLNLTISKCQDVLMINRQDKEQGKLNCRL